MVVVVPVGIGILRTPVITCTGLLTTVVVTTPVEVVVEASLITTVVKLPD